MKDERHQTTYLEQERLVPSIVSLFGEPPNDVISTPQALDCLRSTVASAVHFYYYLTEQFTEPIDVEDEDLDRIVGDVVAYAEYLWNIRLASRVALRRRQKSFIWTAFDSPAQLKAEFIRSYNKLIAPATALVDRYYHLMRLSQLQLIFLGSVFV
jgi:hypothetical protein